MQKVITVSLNGNAYQFEEEGYEALRTYLHVAESRLGADPDRSEIIRDLEQSVADKCARFLGPRKTVVSTPEAEQILREIGPVESGSGTAADDSGDPRRAAASMPPVPPAAPKRLYQIREGAMVSGVCNGLAAYVHLDPTLIRLAFVIGAVIEMMVTDDPPWMTVMLYVALVFLVPYAESPEQLAAAQGDSERIPDRVHAAVEKVKRRFSRQPTVASRH